MIFLIIAFYNNEEEKSCFKYRIYNLIIFILINHVEIYNTILNSLRYCKGKFYHINTLHSTMQKEESIRQHCQ
jgi:hypothetical protein